MSESFFLRQACDSRLKRSIRMNVCACWLLECELILLAAMQCQILTMGTHNVAIRSNLMAVEMLNSLVCWVRAPKRRVSLQKKEYIPQIGWLLSNDRDACHIFLPDYRGSLSEELSGTLTWHTSTLPTLFAFKCDKTKRWLSPTAGQKMD